ncbi:hypothetical protein BD309DRAFT_670890 [Dichomitus squalens]|nr:hypothetical protein BD309DRAFT_670890 [Dichomitus squalens]
MPVAAESIRKAFEDDPLMEYFDAADTAPFPVSRRKLIDMVDWMGAMHQERMLTVEGGMSLMKYGPPGNQTNLPSVAFLRDSLGRLRPEECAKRWKEFGAKARELVSAAFGEKVADMMEIQVLATDPDAQGRGYASALVKYVLRQGDADGRDVWLLTTSAYGFYEHFGFVTVRSGKMHRTARASLAQASSEPKSPVMYTV